MTNKFIPLFKIEGRSDRIFTWGDLLALLFIAVLLYLGIRLAFGAPSEVPGPEISLEPQALPRYALFSIGRMTAAYALSMAFTLVYGRLAAYHRRAEQVLMPLLDVLQSVPILSFLPVVLLSLSAILPLNVAAELASITLIFTSQAWNLTFAWYQSLTTIPKDLREASAIFRLNGWLRFKSLEFPFAAITLVWNSMMSWAGGWFFLMAAEIFTVGRRDFRLPGLGAYLQEAANQGNLQAIFWGLGALILVIIALDQLVWRPLLAWSDRFKVEMVESEEPPTSWFYDLLHSSRLLSNLNEIALRPIGEALDMWLLRHFQPAEEERRPHPLGTWLYRLLAATFLLLLAYGLYRTANMLLQVSPSQWLEIGLGLLATTLRVALALLIALAWTVPLGAWIGSNHRLTAIFQPLIQITASVPATALFPVVLLLLLRLPGGLDLAAVLLMLMGTQWYLLFNVIAGAKAIPQDLKYTATLLHLSRAERWRTLTLPALFPYLITGAITASGGAWNASIVAEHVNFAGQTLHTRGIGALIAQATTSGDYPFLLASTLSMILMVILINRLLWRRLYQIAEQNYRME